MPASTTSVHHAPRGADESFFSVGPTWVAYAIMPAYRFSWNAFDDATLRALARGEGWGEGDGDARLWLSERIRRPNEDFVRRQKATIATAWLPTYAGTKRIVEHLQDAGIGPMGRSPGSLAEAARYVDRCRNSTRLRRYLLDALVRFGDLDRATEEDGGAEFLPRFALLKPSSQQPDERKPHDYQRQAWEKLSAHLAEAQASGTFQGMLVMPTGSGKTYTAVRWLMENVVQRGGRVLWLAHRAELLNQAAREFHKLAAHAPARDVLRVRVVSSEHCATTQIDPADDVLVASIASIARRLDIIDDILKDKRSFVVVDEAHHAAAKSYRSVISKLDDGNRRLLGLTATPTRTAEDERPTLARLFGERVLHTIKTRELIDQKFLADPIPIRVSTDADVEQGLTNEDLATMARFDQLSDAWLERIGEMTPRNRVIVGHYTKPENRAKYGKTLIFAVNVKHAALLTEMLRAEGVSAEYVASYRLEDDAKDNREILQRFRDKNGGIEVLVNVQIVTEGVDLPAIQTVFLSRPTHSEILLRQMIGRALRGPEAGGTPTAYIVSFEDHWERFRDWQDPLALVPDIMVPAAPSTVEPTPATAGAEVPLPPAAVGIEQVMEVLPWDAVVQLVREIRLSGPGYEADVFEAVHHGWYVLERIDEGEQVRQTIALYEHQAPLWEAFFSALYEMTPEQLAAADVDELFETYFADCDVPAPSSEKIHEALEHARAGGERPAYRELAERKQCDPHELAQIIHDGDLGERRRQELLKERYTPLAKAIFPTHRDFQNAVNDALYEIQHPDDATKIIRAVPIFEPRPDQLLRPGPTHNLEALMAEVLATGRAILGHDAPHAGPLTWSKRILKGWYGKAFWGPSDAFGHGRIKINVLLDSPDIDAATLSFLLWHEYLHLFLQQGHTERFRELERKWPGIQAADRQLDTLNDKFGVQYW